MSKKWKILLLIVIIFAAAFVAGKVAWNNAVVRSYPQIEGELKLAGLQGEVRVVRDEMGIPNIYAGNLHDLFYAQGYVHAQDRFWQMDFWRHIGMGRLSDMFGKSQADTDKFLRTLQWEDIAKQELTSMDPESITILDAYAEGVNAYIIDKDSADLSVEYVILKALAPDYTVSPWTPTNTLTWAKAMAWDLRGNMEEEIDRAILLKTLSPAQVADLYPGYPADHPSIAENFIPDMDAQPNASAAGTSLNFQDQEINALVSQVFENAGKLDPVLGEFSRSVGSNNWVVDGTLTATGKPLLANDPHLGIQMPSIWYQVGLHCQPRSEACPYEVAGFSFAGVPGVVIGHNDRIAWAFTNTGPDVMDLYVEKINPDNPNQYEYKGEWVDMEVIEQEASFGGDPEKFVIRKTIHGPIISDVFGALKNEVEPTKTPFVDRAGIDLPENYAIALRWTALEPGSVFEAIWGFNKAQNWNEFRAAGQHFVVPAQNLLYADVDGNIGYQMPGNIPIRSKGDGRLPVPGWTGEYEWTGYIPFEQLPNIYNPESGYIVTANNQVVPQNYPYLISTDWDYGFRADRIKSMLQESENGIEIADFQRIQGDDTNLTSYLILDTLAGVDMPQDLSEVRDTVLMTWDHHENASAGAALYEAFWWELVSGTFMDENIPEDVQPAGGSRTNEIFRHLVQDPNSAWWDDKTTTDKVETRDDIFAAALGRAVNCEVCIKKFGTDISKWDWSILHSATFRNATLGESGISLIENIFNRGPYPVTGGESIVNATGWDIYDSFEVNWLPSMRMIVDLSDLNNSVTVHTTGQSGHAFHTHYDDLIPLWSGLRYYPMLWSDASVNQSAEGVLILLPLQ